MVHANGLATLACLHNREHCALLPNDQATGACGWDQQHRTGRVADDALGLLPAGSGTNRCVRQSRARPGHGLRLSRRGYFPDRRDGAI